MGGGEPQRDLFRRQNLANSVKEVEKKTSFVFGRSAIPISSRVGLARQKLMDEIAVGPVDFNAVEARPDCAVRRVTKLVHDALNLFDGSRLRDRRLLVSATQIRIHAFGGNCLGRDGQLAIKQIRMRDAALMPQLTEDPSSGSVNSFGDLAPALHLLRRIDAGHIFPAVGAREMWVPSVIIKPAVAR